MINVYFVTELLDGLTVKVDFLLKITLNIEII